VKFIRRFLDNQEKHFLKGGKLHDLYYLYEVIDAFFYTSDKVTTTSTHVRDSNNIKRVMLVVMIALVPAILFGLYNTGLQANLELAKVGTSSLTTWQQKTISAMGIGFDPNNILGNMIQGTLYFLPIYILTLVVGIFWEVVFACVRKHEVNEGLFVTSLLFPLILPPNIPYWQVALGISFGVVIGKEVFGGVGMNILNPALVGRVFLFFAYPASISGDRVWVAVDGVSRATPLAALADQAMTMTSSWWDAFIGLIPGSMGETSTLACILGAVILIAIGIGSWRIMLYIVVGMVGTSLLLNVIGSSTNPMFNVSPMWHLVLGGFAFGTVFMATDPVTAAFTHGGKVLYGLLIGFLVVLIRVVNPAFPEGMMLAILFGNVFAPIFDKIYINKNIKRRLLRNVA